MSLNTSHAGKDGVVLFNTERILIFYDGVEMGFDKVDDHHFKGKKTGKIYLTTHRVVFVNKDVKDKLLSLSMPFHTLKGLELEQPVFGANYITGKLKAEQGGNWQGEAKFKMWFNKGGAIEFGKALLQAGKLASRYAPPQPPPYIPPTAPYYQAPPPAYAPPTGPVYGFVPFQTFPNAPPAGTVFMYDVPPPYPGVDPTLAPYPFVNPGVPGAEAHPFQPPPYQAGPGPQPPNGAVGGQPPYNGPTGQPPYNGPTGQPPYNGPTGQPPYNGQGGLPPYGMQPPYGPPVGQPPYGAPVQNPYGGSPYNPYGTTSGQPTYNANQSAAAAAKEAEAFGYGGQAFYDPSQPQNLYMAPPPPGENRPPPYNETNKKEN